MIQLRLLGNLVRAHFRLAHGLAVQLTRRSFQQWRL
jgi:hypothetical protein